MKKDYFKPSSAMTFATVPVDWQRLESYAHKNKSLIIDLGEVQYCDSAGLSLLVSAQKLGQAQKKLCTFIKIPKAIYSLAEFSGLTTILFLK